MELVRKLDFSVKAHILVEQGIREIPDYYYYFSPQSGSVFVPRWWGASCYMKYTANLTTDC